MALEYSPPARGTWTIAHVPLLIPGSHIIFVGAACCMRGVVLSAAECGAMDRFSMVVVKEDDLFSGKMESMFIDGVSEILDAKKRNAPLGAVDTLPPAVVLFSGCIHDVAGSDMEWIASKLEERYPTVDFIVSKMNPTMRKSGITPEELMRKQLYYPLGRSRYRPLSAMQGRHFTAEKSRAVNIIGNIAARSENSEPFAMLQNALYTVRDICTVKTYDEYLDMENSIANIYMVPVAEKGVKELSNRLGQRLFYFPVTFNMSALEDILCTFAKYFTLPLPDITALRSEAEGALRKAAEAAEGMKVAIDFTAVSRPFELSRLLIEHGFNVETVYTDAVAEGDDEAYKWCKENVKELKVTSPTAVTSRFLHNKAINTATQSSMRQDCAKRQYLAIGQKAAYFCNTPHFVNIIENGSLWGFTGIKEIARMIEDAAERESDMKNTIQVKALGCAEACAALREIKEEGLRRGCNEH